MSTINTVTATGPGRKLSKIARENPDAYGKKNKALKKVSIDAVQPHVIEPAECHAHVKWVCSLHEVSDLP